MTRHPSVKVAQRNEAILLRMRALKAKHAFWGYPVLGATALRRGLANQQEVYLAAAANPQPPGENEPPVEGLADAGTFLSCCCIAPSLALSRNN